MKRMKNIRTIAALALLAVMTLAMSCGGRGSSVDAALSQIEKAMDKVAENKTSMTEADWEMLGEELEQPAAILKDALESNDVSAMQKIKITAAMLRYTAVVSEAALHTVTDSLKIKMEEAHFADSLSAATDQLQKALNSDEMKEAMKELQKVAEELEKKTKK